MSVCVSNYVWLRVAMFSCVWLCVAVLDCVWLCMAVNAFAWLCLASGSTFALSCGLCSVLYPRLEFACQITERNEAGRNDTIWYASWGLLWPRSKYLERGPCAARAVSSQSWSYRPASLHSENSQTHNLLIPSVRGCVWAWARHGTEQKLVGSSGIRLTFSQRGSSSGSALPHL